jgi:ArsR family transcriptional regulator, arsenate/arsenite/antimonite-responsive transcriptional repressor / arsenate reductase (thioredoxin)
LRKYTDQLSVKHVNPPATPAGSALAVRAAMYAALGEPARLAIVDDLAVSDWSPKELGARLGLPSNVLAHHLDVLEQVGLVVRFGSAGDRRRKYVRLVREPLWRLSTLRPRPPAGPMLFVCSQNSARSQLAAALWSARTGLASRSAGTRPARCVNRGAVAAARRAGLAFEGGVPQSLGVIPDGTQVVTVCDQAHEELTPASDWWHWSIPDPVATGTAAAFDAVVADLNARISTLLDSDLRTEQATQ